MTTGGRHLRVLAVTLFAHVIAAQAACFHGKVVSGLPPGRPAPAYEDRWYSTFLLGTTGAGRGVPLRESCRDGWAEVEFSVHPAQLLIAWVTLGIYTPATVTIICARPPDARRASVPPALTTRRTFPAAPPDPDPLPDDHVPGPR